MALPYGRGWVLFSRVSAGRRLEMNPQPDVSDGIILVRRAMEKADFAAEAEHAR